MKKNIIILIALGFSLVGLPSCNKNLDLAPISSISDANYWKTADQFDAFVNGVHSSFRGHERAFVHLGELRADAFGNDPGTTGSFTGEAPQGLERMWLQTLDMDNPGVGNYGGFYSNINQLNLLINKLNTTAIVSETDKNYYLGVAHGMRAFYYFHLYRSWDKAIIQTEAIADIDISNLAKAASSGEEVLALVKQDIDQSLNSFAGDYSFRKGRSFWSKAASLMLKAEVYLWTAHRAGGAGDAAIAKNALTEIQSNTALSLIEPFSQVFAYNNKGSNEIIFAVRHQLNEATLGFIGDFVPQAGLIANYYDSLDNRKFTVTQENYGGLLRIPTKIATYRQYHDLDSRKNTSIQAAYEKEADGDFKIAGAFLKKYQGQQDAGSRAYTNDFPIYRYADLLLLLAEAKAILGENPAAEINQIRARAFGANYDPARFAYPNQAIDSDPYDAILQERFLEFVGEGKRWYDLRRFGDSYVYEHTTLTSADAYKLLWPIDRTTLTNNRELKQTPGYPEF